MEAGVFVAFFESGEPLERELPPIGPLDHVVVRHRQLVADRSASAHAPDAGVDVAKWLEAELEYQRATGAEPGGPKHSEMRISARDGVFLRFAVFGDARERDIAPELGPYAVVVVGKRGVEADGQLLATRASSDLAPWELGAAAGSDAAGLHKADLAFRTPSTGYHAQIVPLPQRRAVEDTFAPRATATRPPPLVSGDTLPPPVAEPPVIEAEPVFREPAPALTATDLAMIQRVEQQRAEDTLRARMLDEERRRLGVDGSDESATTWAMRYRQAEPDEVATETAATTGLDLGAALWRMRFAIIGVLLLLTGAYGFTVIRSNGASTVPGQAPIQYVNIAQRVSSDRWDYVTNGVQRSQNAGNVAPRGVYYVVRLGITNRSSEGAQLSPSQFVLVDATGIEHGAETTLSGAYQNTDNPQSQFVWPQSFPVGRTVTVPIIFDVDPSLPRGSLLKIFDLPSVRVKLD